MRRTALRSFAVSQGLAGDYSEGSIVRANIQVVDGGEQWQSLPPMSLFLEKSACTESA
jgi:hypothetical protein